MDRAAFHKLCFLLQSVCGLKPYRRVTVHEKVAICVLRMHVMLMVKPQPVKEDMIDPRWQPFQGCLGALDGTYIDVQIQESFAFKDADRVNRVVRVRRSWSKFEEDSLIMCLTDVMHAGWKSENGFRAGFQRDLEKGMRKIMSGTDIVANPHINSKIHVWKKDYDPCVKGLQYKTWPYYPQWIEIFGKDMATGENAIDPIDLVNELYNNRMDREWEIGEREFMKFLKVAMTGLSAGNDKGSVSSNENKRLNDIMNGIVGLKLSDKLKVCDELVQNSKRLNFFLSLPTNEQEEYVWMLLDGRI
ncbi:hypothetical protein ACS0TY_024866 [Phlomoides rotata]